jgi:uncharacterized protein YcbK (DUF882 family)
MLLACGCCALLPAAARAEERTAEPDWRSVMLQGARSLWLVRGGDEVRVTYWAPETGYDGDAYKQVCRIMRDVQADKTFAMSLRLLDVLCGLQNWLKYNKIEQPIQINSGYRTFKTNSRLEGSALNSRHLSGQAADIVVPGVPLLRLAGMASAFGQGGIGMYLNKGFVHVDTGDERLWVR